MNVATRTLLEMSAGIEVAGGARGALLGRVKRTDRCEDGTNLEATNRLDAYCYCRSRRPIQSYVSL